jgi:hypothetical protein
MSEWEQSAQMAIREALRGVDRSDLKAVQRAIDDAYPFGARAHWPYKVWLKVRREFLAEHQPPVVEPLTEETAGPLFGGAA